jgi:hypothetical protein
MTTISKSSVMTRAWSLVRSASLSMGAALSRAWKELKLQAVKEAMQIGFLWITFRKIDGSICTKKATRKLDLIPDPDKPKGSGGAAGSPAVLAFYSETDHAWRSFRTDNLLTFKAA